jgi:hypothetical protein
MRGWIVLITVFLSSAALAEEWVVVRRSPETGEAAPAGILVDVTSIEVIDGGIRRARVKVDFLSRRLAFESFGPTVLNFDITTVLYDCDKQLKHEESMEQHWIDGSVHILDWSKDPKWYPVPVTHRAAIPDFDFVCGWKPK